MLTVLTNCSDIHLFIHSYIYYNIYLFIDNLGKIKGGSMYLRIDFSKINLYCLSRVKRIPHATFPQIPNTPANLYKTLTIRPFQLVVQLHMFPDKSLHVLHPF